MATANANHNTTLEHPHGNSNKSASSPQRSSIGDGLTLKPTTNILRRSSRKLFRRPMLEKNVPPPDVQSPSKEQQIDSASEPPKVEIIYKQDTSVPQTEQESPDQQSVTELTKAFESEETALLRPSSIGSGERSPSTISDESVPPLSPVSAGLVDDGMSQLLSTSSCTERVERVLKELIETERTYVYSLKEIIEVRATTLIKLLLSSYEQLWVMQYGEIGVVLLQCGLMKTIDRLEWHICAVLEQSMSSKLCIYNPFPHFEGQKNIHRQSQGEENRGEAITTGQSILPFWPSKDPGHVVK